MGVGHGDSLAPVASCFSIGAAGFDIFAAGCHFARRGSGPLANCDTAA